jgi:hypothetical protein
LEPLDRRVIARAVAAYGGDHGVGRGDNAWTCERHLKSLLFAQVAGLTSLRQIITGLGANSRWFYHLNLRPPRRATLADANAEQPAAVFRDLALALIAVAAGAPRDAGESLIRRLDATPIRLKGNGFPWAEANARMRGLKLHLLHDAREHRPVWFEAISAKIDKPALAKAGVVAGRAIPREAGAIPAFAGAGFTFLTRAIPITAGGRKSLTPRPSLSPGASATRIAATLSNSPPRGIGTQLLISMFRC